MSQCFTCEASPCVNPSFCRACRQADTNHRLGMAPRYPNRIGKYTALELRAAMQRELSPLEKSLLK